MNVLLDENLPQRLHSEFQTHHAVSVAYLGWNGKENGDLIKLMIDHDYQVLVTLDKNLQYQQNFSILSGSSGSYSCFKNGIQISQNLNPSDRKIS